MIRVLLDMAERFDQAYREAKRERNVLDFNDLEHLALEVLLEEVHQEHGDMDGQQKKGAWEISRQPSAAAEELRSQYEEILVDEYQDSNLVQETLIGSISRERIGHPNVFMVGDVKQSIYRWRSGDWRLLNDIEREFGIESMPEEETYETVSGFIMYMLRRVPKRGDFVEYAGYRFEVTNMDGFHIDQVLMRRADHHVKHADKAEKVEKAPEGGADASAADQINPGGTK